MKFVMTKHARMVAGSYGLSDNEVLDICESVKPYPSFNHPGQQRYCGKGYCVVVAEGGVRVITIYKDKIITPLRDDQIRNGVVIRRKK